MIYMYDYTHKLIYIYMYIYTGQKQSYEETLAVTYQPLSVFRVRPVTRCIETMPGHTDAILHVSYRYYNMLIYSYICIYAIFL
jgi:hypothetical protein